MNRTVAGVDIGGTKIAIALVDERGAILVRDQIPTDEPRGPQAAVSNAIALLRDLMMRANVTRLYAIGIGAPGPLDARRGEIVFAPNLRSFWGYPLAQQFANAFRVPVAMENDASAAAFAEYLFGAGRGVDNMVYLTLSTGVGAGAVLGGRLYTGETGNGVEIGHATIDRDGPLCGCGGKGHLEAYASGTAIAKAAGLPSSVEVVDAVRRGDAAATRVWDAAMEALSVGLGNVINVFNPRRIILGGGLTAAGPLLFDRVRASTPKYALKPLADDVEIVEAALGADVGTLGAAAVALSVRPPRGS